MSEVWHSCLHEIAFDFSGVDFVFSHDLEYSFEMLEVFVFVSAVDSNIIDVDNCEFS